MPPRHRRPQVAVHHEEQKEIAASVLAEENPPPSLLDVIMEKVLDQHQPDQQQQMLDGYDEFGNEIPDQAAPGERQPARHPERPVLCRAVLCGEVVSDASAVRIFIEEACAAASAAASEADPLKGKMIARADSLGIPQEFMKVMGVFVELPKHFWVVLEAEPVYLHTALGEIAKRLERGAAAKAAAAAATAAGHDDKKMPSAAAAAAAAGGSKAAQQQQSALGGAGAGSGRDPSFDGANNLHVAFYADDVVERLTHRWTTVDLSNAPTAVAGGEGQTPALDEYVVECIFSIGEQVTTQSTVGGALGGTRGLSALADTARNARLATRTLPRDDLTEKIKSSGLFFSLKDFVKEFCTAATAVPVLYTDLIHPIEPEMEY